MAEGVATVLAFAILIGGPIVVYVGAAFLGWATGYDRGLAQAADERAVRNGLSRRRLWRALHGLPEDEGRPWE